MNVAEVSGLAHNPVFEGCSVTKHFKGKTDPLPNSVQNTGEPILS